MPFARIRVNAEASGFVAVPRTGSIVEPVPEISWQICERTRPFEPSSECDQRHLLRIVSDTQLLFVHPHAPYERRQVLLEHVHRRFERSAFQLLHERIEALVIQGSLDLSIGLRIHAQSMRALVLGPLVEERDRQLVPTTRSKRPNTRDERHQQTRRPSR